MSQITSKFTLSPTVPTTFHTGAGDAAPALNAITIAGGTNIGTTGAGSTVTVNLDNKIVLPVTDAGNTQGSIAIGTSLWHAYGIENIFIDGGNFTLNAAAEYNIAIGSESLSQLTSGSGNVCIGGLAAGASLSTGGNNTCIGYRCGLKLSADSSNNLILGAYAFWDFALTGNYNIVLNNNMSGLGFTGSSNIIIGTNGAGESNTLRIGTQGGGISQINRAFIAGIYGTAVGATAGVAIVDSTHQLGTLSGSAGKVLQGGTKPAWSTATYPSTATIGDVLVASAANVIGVVAGATTAGFLLTANGAGTAPTFQAPPAGVTYASDAETIAGTESAKAVAPSNLKAKLGLQTIHALPVGNSDSLALDWLAVGGDGTVLIGNTAADPSFSASPTVTTMYATTFDTNVAAAAVTLSGTTLAADGTDADININITAKGTGQVIIDDLQLTTDLAVTEGGTGASTLTDHGILLGSGTGAITPLGEASNGQIPIGSTGNDPVLATITAGTNCTVTNAAGSITISSTTVGINDQTASYQLVAADAGKLITMTVAGANTLTVPKDATVDFTVGTQILVYQGGAGTTTIAPEDVAITIRSAGGLLDLFAQYSVASLTKIDANLWVLSGDIG